MNGVFAEECIRLLLVKETGVSLQPADLSNTTVFMLRLVPQLCLPVVLPVLLFPNSSSNSPFQFSFFYAAISFFQNMIHAVYMPQYFLTLNPLRQKYAISCSLMIPNDVQSTYEDLRMLLMICSSLF